MKGQDRIFSGTVEVGPARGLKGKVSVPGDKSISHRSIILSSIADGVSEVYGFLEGADNLSTMAAFRKMGVGIEELGPGRLRIHGVGLNGLKEPEDVVDAGNSGTTARLLSGLLSAQQFFSVLTGDESLRRRPMKRVVEPLRRMGAAITGRKDGSLLPLSISGRRLTGAAHSLGVASAQVKSALLLAGLYADGRTSVTEPEKSRDHTERMLRLFGADVAVDGNTVSVGGCRGFSGREITVPGDISSAAFLMVAALVTEGSDILIEGVGVNPTRVGVINVLRAMGGSIEITNARESSGEPVADIRVKSSGLKGISITGSDLLPAIDEFPILCVAAACARGATLISGAAELRVKESDRIKVMSESLRAVGVDNEEHPDGISIAGRGSAGGPVFSSGARIFSRGDHRIAMAFAVAALRSESGITIDGADSVDVSFPGFFPLIERLRA